MLYDLKSIKNLTILDSISLQNYLKEVNKYPLLSLDEEVELGKKIKEFKCRESMDKMVMHNLRFSITVAKQYSNVRHQLIELINVANIGLIESAKLFDYTRGYKFITYAVWYIKKEIIDYISQDYVVKPSYKIINNMVKINRYINEFVNENEYYPTMNDISNEFDFSECRLMPSIGLYNNSVKYIDVKHIDYDESESCNLPCDNETLYPDHNFNVRDNKDLIDRLLIHLTDRQKLVIKYYFGLDGESEKTLEVIAGVIGASRETIRIDLNKSLEIMKNVNPS